MMLHWQKLFTMILCVFNVQQRQKCILNTRMHFGEPLPVIIRNGRLLEPTNNEGDVILDYGDTMTLSCEGSGTISHPAVKEHVESGTISCLGGENFENDQWLNAPARFSMFNCLDAPNHHSQRTNRTCFNGNRVIEIGYTVQHQFYPLYESCFDEGNLNVLYSKYTQKPYNALFQTKVDRPFFIDNGHYGDIHVNWIFSPKGQKSAVAQLVGRMIHTYVNSNEFLSRGHLAAKTDFVYAFSERATFHYANCAPQWYGFNSGNWNTLEVDLRNHIHYAGYDTIVYTGTYGVTQLFDDYGRRVDIYLSTDDNNNPVIPVPLYFYKVVYEPSSKRGIAYVGINNPYYSAQEARELFFCTDICRGTYNFSWLTWHPDNPTEGYAFCCTIPDFQMTVHHLPQFEVLSVLI